MSGIYFRQYHSKELVLFFSGFLGSDRILGVYPGFCSFPRILCFKHQFFVSVKLNEGFKRTNNELKSNIHAQSIVSHF